MLTPWIVVLLAVASCTTTAYTPPPSNDGFNVTEGTNWAYLAGIAYCPEDKIASWSCGSACERMSMVDSTTIKVFTNGPRVLQAYTGATKDGVPFLSFRGTLPFSLTDWIKDDLMFFHTTPYELSDCDGCEVHEGFYDSYNALRTDILAALGALKPATPDGFAPPVYVTGHSLGAAMAVLAVFDLQAQGWDVQKSFTFGCPRVGNTAFEEAYVNILGGVRDQVHRVVHYDDPVPHLPLELMGFHHTPTEVWYNEDQSSYVVCDGSGEDPQCSDSLLLDINILDHLSYMGIPIATLCGIPTSNPSRALSTADAAHSVEFEGMQGQEAATAFNDALATAVMARLAFEQG